MNNKAKKILIIGGVIIVIIVGSIFAYKKTHKNDIELGKIEYKNHKYQPKPKENNNSNDEKPKEENKVVEEEKNPNENLKANNDDLKAADKADFGQYPFTKFKKENSKLLEGPEVNEYKKLTADHVNNFIRELEKAKQSGQTGMTDGVQKELNSFFIERDTSKFSRMVNDIMADDKELSTSPDDILVFANDDPTYETNKPTLIGIRCKCNGNEIVYYLQGLAIMNKNAESFLPFATVEAEDVE